MLWIGEVTQCDRCKMSKPEDDPEPEGWVTGDVVGGVDGGFEFALCGGCFEILRHFFVVPKEA